MKQKESKAEAIWSILCETFTAEYFLPSVLKEYGCSSDIIKYSEHLRAQILTTRVECTREFEILAENMRTQLFNLRRDLMDEKEYVDCLKNTHLGELSKARNEGEQLAMTRFKEQIKESKYLIYIYI